MAWQCQNIDDYDVARRSLRVATKRLVEIEHQRAQLEIEEQHLREDLPRRQANAATAEQWWQAHRAAKRAAV